MTRTRSIALSLSVLSLAAGLTAGCGGSSDDGFRKDGSKIDGDPSTTLPAARPGAAQSARGPRHAGDAPPAQAPRRRGATDVKKAPTIPKPTGAAPKVL